MFSLDEKVVYPGHGVAQISRIIEKKVGGSKATFFELQFLNKDMTVLVPTHNLESVGLRRLCSLKKIDSILKDLAEPSQRVLQELVNSNWNKRNKDYQCKLRTGELQELCTIYRDLKYIAAEKELSFGEKNLLQQTEGLLAQEISLVKKVDHDKAIQDLRSLFNHAQGTTSAAPTGI